MGLFSLFKSKVEKEAIGNSLTCAVCGKVYYELKASSLPFELTKKYYLDTAVQCNTCGKVYCSGGYGRFCSMRGCSCGGRVYIAKNCVSKFSI